MALAVVADEGVRHVHAVLGLGGDQAVALVVDELLDLGLLPELREGAIEVSCSTTWPTTSR